MSFGRDQLRRPYGLAMGSQGQLITLSEKSNPQLLCHFDGLQVCFSCRFMTTHEIIF